MVLDVADDRARSVAALSRYDVLLVNPVRDGLNLVAKEGPLVNAADGVVVLSEEAGAFEELAARGPRDQPLRRRRDAEALDRALRMGAPTSGADRAERLRRTVAGRTAADWLADLLAEAGGTEPPQQRSARRARRPRAPSGPSTTRSAAAATSGGLSGSTTATRATATPARASSARATKAGRSPRSSPKQATAEWPGATVRTTVPLSPETGGRSSRAIRPGWATRPVRAVSASRNRGPSPRPRGGRASAGSR